MFDGLVEKVVLCKSVNFLTFAMTLHYVASVGRTHNVQWKQLTL